MIRAIFIRIACVVFIGWSAVWSHALSTRSEATGVRGAQAVADAGVRMQARWAGTELSGSFRLEGVMTEAAWKACLGPDHVPQCPEGRALAAYFPPASAALGRTLARSWQGDEFQTPVAAAILSWYAGITPDRLEVSELKVMAVATSAMLGNPVQGVVQHPVAGVEILRRALAAKCGACAPSPSVLETYKNPFMPVSVVLAGEVLARGGGAGTDPVPPLGSLVARVRRGESISEDVLAQPGQAGLVALEWGRFGPGAAPHVPALVAMASAGPSETDRLAALYALLRIADGKLEEVGPTWESLPGGEEVLRKAHDLAPYLSN